MVERTVTVTSATGLHARPAAIFVQTVQQYPDTHVFLRKGEREVNGRSLLSVLSMGVRQGESVVIRCEGPRENEAMAALAALLEGGPGE